MKLKKLKKQMLLGLLAIEVGEDKLSELVNVIDKSFKKKETNKKEVDNYINFRPFHTSYDGLNEELEVKIKNIQLNEYLKMDLKNILIKKK